MSCSSFLKYSEAHEAICEVARETASVLVIMGAHRRDAARNAFTGTTAERMLLVGSTPLLIVRSESEGAYTRPVIAVNIEDEDVSNIERFRTLGLVPDEAIIPIFGYESGQFQIVRSAGSTRAELKAVYEEEKPAIAPIVDRFMERAKLAPDQARVQPLFYNTPDTILSAAREEKADLLVVGSRRKTAFKRFTLGSVSEACILRSEIDLLVLPPEG